jgi:phosphatidate cytidylyltransferase
MLRTRIITVAVVLPLFLAALFLLPDFYWAAFALLAILWAAGEWANLARFSQAQVGLYMALTLALAAAFWSVAQPGDSRRWVVFVLLGLNFVFWVPYVAWSLKTGRAQLPTSNRLVVGLIGWVVLLPPWLALIELRRLSPLLLLGILTVIWLADTAAYFCGRAFGKHKLAPVISPGKTWEGLIGALAAAAVYGVGALLLVARYRGRPFTFSDAALTAVLTWFTVVLSVVGDLFESWIKRRAGVKDSGTLLPGHGGILDRIDSLTSTLPFAALLVLVFKPPML